MMGDWLEHRAIVHLPVQCVDERGECAVCDLEEQLQIVLIKSRAGWLDRTERTDDGCLLYLYGDDPKELIDIVEPELRRTSIAQGYRVMES